MEIISKFIRKGRMYAVTEENGRRLTMPLANCVWLNGNPSFKSIPKGYVIHHLDLDPLNDDISNLALMYKFHHIAYHWKHKNVEVPIDCNVALTKSEMGGEYPVMKPRVGTRNYNGKPWGYWFITYRTTEGKKKWIYSLNGKRFQSQEIASRAINVIWPNNNWDKTTDATINELATKVQRELLQS